MSVRTHDRDVIGSIDSGRGPSADALFKEARQARRRRLRRRITLIALPPLALLLFGIWAVYLRPSPASAPRAASAPIYPLGATGPALPFYVGNTTGNSIAELDLSRLQRGGNPVIGQWGVATPSSIVTSKDGSTIFDAPERGDGIIVFDVSKHLVTRKIPLDIGAPHQIAVSPDGRTLYLLFFSRRNVIISVNAETGAVGAAIDAGPDLSNLALSPAGATALVTTENGVSQVSLRAGRVEHKYGFGSAIATAVAVTPNGRLALTTLAAKNLGPRKSPQGWPTGPGTVAVVDIASQKVVRKVTVPTAPSSLAMTPAGWGLVLSCPAAPLTSPRQCRVTEVDPYSGTTRPSVEVPAHSTGIIASPDGRTAAVFSTQGVTGFNVRSNRVIGTAPTSLGVDYPYAWCIPC
jgi:hypothetical protein